MATLEIRDLHANVGDTPILRGVNLTIRPGEIHALMGPNGTGKSTLASVIMGHPDYEVTQGEVLLDGVNLLEMEADERSRAGVFLCFQYPVAIPGVSIANFLRMALNARRKAINPEDKGISIPEFRKLLRSKMDLLQMNHDFAGRYLNEGFSGGEKKRAEILQMSVFEPHFAVLDETDSGLDIDALRIVSDGINSVMTHRNNEMGVLLITHYQRMLNYVKPHFVHIMLEGRIVRSGGPELAEHLEEFGYEKVREETTE